jgi:hypothetical protein
MYKTIRAVLTQNYCIVFIYFLENEKIWASTHQNVVSLFADKNKEKEHT